MSTTSDKDTKSPESVRKELELETVEANPAVETEVTDEILAEKVTETEGLTETVEKPAEDDQQPMEVEIQSDADKEIPSVVQEETIVEEQSEAKDSQDDEPMSSVEDGEDTQTMSEGIKSPKGTISNGVKTDENLLSEEHLDRESPEIWPEKIPGVQDFVQEHATNASEAESSSPPTWTKGLTQDDIDQMHELGAMTNAQLILEIKKLYDHAYKIGIEEAKEMSRGKILQIFLNTKKK